MYFTPKYLKTIKYFTNNEPKNNYYMCLISTMCVFCIEMHLFDIDYVCVLFDYVQYVYNYVFKVTVHEFPKLHSRFS